VVQVPETHTESCLPVAGCKPTRRKAGDEIRCVDDSSVVEVDCFAQIETQDRPAFQVMREIWRGAAKLA
jgi:hypothetical protein